MRITPTARRRAEWTPRPRTAFTLIEMLSIVVIIGIMLAIAAPRLSLTSRAIKVQSAAVDLSARLTMARQSAISRGAESMLHHSANKVWVTVNYNGVQTLLKDTLFLRDRYGVSVAASMDTIRYNSRGFAKLGASQTFRISKDGDARTVCVTAGGQVLPRGCAL